MKGTFGRISRGPHAYSRPSTVVLGTLARSVRDAARHYDVCAGTDLRDPTSLPSAGDWERNLGSTDLAGKRVAVLPSIAAVTLEAGVESHIRAAGQRAHRGGRHGRGRHLADAAEHGGALGVRQPLDAAGRARSDVARLLPRT